MKNLARKKILFLITKSNWGGAQRYVYDLATGLDSTKFEAVVALGGDGALKELLTHAGIRTVSIHSLERDVSIKKEWEFFKELWLVVRTERPDILHVNSSKAGGVGTLVGRLARVPRVLFTAHGWAFNEDRPLGQRIIIKTLHWATVLLSHKTIAVSNAVLQQMNWPGAAKKLKVINPGRTIGVMYGGTEAREKIADFFPRLTPHLSAPWVITIAELHPIKRLSVLIEAMTIVNKTLPKAISVVIGEGQERKQLEALIEHELLSETVFLVGAITEAARFLKAGNVFVLPSKSESYGYVVHEAGLAKVPVVATRVGGITDIISSSKEGLLVAPNDASSLAAAIIETLKQPDEASARVETLATKLMQRSTKQMILVTTALYELPLN